MVDFRLRSGPVMGAVTVLAVMSVGLGGCSGLGRALGMSKTSPDEFAVVTKAPLVMPPDYELRPPKPGAERPQEIQATEAAKQALFPNVPESQGTPAATAGEQALLADAAGNGAGPQIGTQNPQNKALLVRKSRSFANRLLFGQANAIPASVVDAAAERQRLLQTGAAASTPDLSPDMGQPADQATDGGMDPAAGEETGQPADQTTDEGMDPAAGEETGQTADQATDQDEGEEADKDVDEKEKATITRKKEGE